MDVRRRETSTTEVIARTEAVPGKRDSAFEGTPAAPVRRSKQPSLAKPHSPRPVKTYIDEGFYPEPGLGVWGGIVGAMVFTPFLMTLAVDPRTDAIGVAGFAFCGPMTVLIASGIMRKLWFRHMHATAVQVQITGGVPVRPSRATPLVIYGTTTVAGVIWVTFGRSVEPIFWFRWVPAAVGSCCLLGLAVGWLPVGYIQLNPEPITFARRRFAYTVPWDAIAGMSARAVEPRPALRICLHDLNLVPAHPAQHESEMLKHLELRS